MKNAVKIVSAHVQITMIVFRKTMENLNAAPDLPLPVVEVLHFVLLF
jgi:hypothetical protein